MCCAALRRCVRVILLAAAMMSAGPSLSQAQVSVEAPAGEAAQGHYLVLAGRIDVHALYSFVRLMGDARISEAHRPILKLESVGGSVTAAMAIGHLVRDRGFATVVDRGKECLSACVLILAAGVERFISSARVGVHRPRHGVAVAAPTMVAQARANDELIEDMRRYLEAMGTSEQLFASMVAVSPDSMKLLSRGEMHAFGLLAGHANAPALGFSRGRAAAVPLGASGRPGGRSRDIGRHLRAASGGETVVVHLNRSKQSARKFHPTTKLSRSSIARSRQPNARQGLTLMRSPILGEALRKARHGIDLANWRVRPSH